MRIGLVTGEYPPMQGGVGAHCRVLAQTLTAQGHSVHIFSDTRADEPDTRLHLTNTATRWGWETMRAVKRWAVSEQLDLINLHFQTAAFHMSPWVHFMPDFLRPMPLVTTFHDLRFPYLFPKAGKLRDWVVMRLARNSDGVIVTNHEDIARLAHLPHTALIPIGSSVKTTLPANYQQRAWRKRARASLTDLLIAHFGFINHSKGINVLMESVASLHDDGIPVILLMIGGRTGASDPTNATYANTIDRQITALGLNDVVCWTGFLEDEEVSAYLAAADVVTLPFLDGASYRRSSLMAAIQHGCPIVTTQPSVSIPPFEENLTLIPAGDSIALAATLKRLHETPSELEQMREAVQGLRAVFDWDVIAADNARFFEKILKARR